MKNEAYCKGSWAIGSACGVCWRCRAFGKANALLCYELERLVVESAGMMRRGESDANHVVARLAELLARHSVGP